MDKNPQFNRFSATRVHSEDLLRYEKQTEEQPTVDAMLEILADADDLYAEDDAKAYFEGIATATDISIDTLKNDPRVAELLQEKIDHNVKEEIKIWLEAEIEAGGETTPDKLKDVVKSRLVNLRVQEAVFSRVWDHLKQDLPVYYAKNFATQFKNRNEDDGFVAEIENVFSSDSIWAIIDGLKRNKVSFSEKFSKLAINYKRNLSQKLYTRFTGSPRQNFYKMADQIFYEYSVRAPRGFNQRLITTYAPLLEKNIVKLGINVPEKERLFHIFYRKIVTSLDPRMAKIRTNRGDFTMHSGTYYITTDILKMFLMNTLKKFFKKKKIEVTNPEIYSVVRNFTQTKNLLELLKSYKIINKNVELKNIDNRYLGRLVSLGKLIKYIGENSKI